MKRYLFILVIVFGGFAVYLYMTKPQPPAFRGAEGLSLSSTGSGSYALRYTLLFENINTLRTQVGTLKINTAVNGYSLLPLENELNYTLSSGEVLRYPVELRFTAEEVGGRCDTADFSLKINGNLASDMLMGGYSTTFDYDK